MARALILLAALLLALPGAFVALKGVAALRRKDIVVQGRHLEGRSARAAGAILAAYGVAMFAMGAAVAVLALGR
jgi:hypothetical protein